jgi:hypothetical protein
MTTSAQPYPGLPAAPRPAPKPLLEWVFDPIWPDRTAPRPRLLLAAVLVGVLAAVVVPDRSPGLGMFLVFASLAGVVTASDRRLWTAPTLAALGLCLLLGSMVVLRDAEWVVVLCVLAALAVAATTLVGAGSFLAVAEAAVAVPFAGLRCLPWVGRSLVAGRPGRAGWSVVRTVVLSGVLAAVFGGLFASADAVFSDWADAVVPNLTLDTLAARLFVLGAVTGATLAFAYLGLNPPRHGRMPAAKPVARTFEWLLPVGVVVALFVAFVAAQLTVMFGGHDYLARTTGVTYAEYVHQGFAQMSVATMLTLGVIAAAVAKAPRETERQRRLLRVALGALGVLALVVVASALYRIHVYEQAYGFTRPRLLVSFFEGWLGLLLVLVLAAGIRLRAGWLPRATVLTGAGALLALAALNPDSYIASHNVERYRDTGKIDTAYLAGLSADATPALTGLPAGLAACVLTHPDHDDWLAWNLGRARAADIALPTGRCEHPHPG